MLWKEENVLQGREGLGLQGQTEAPAWELCDRGDLQARVLSEQLEGHIHIWEKNISGRGKSQR